MIINENALKYDERIALSLRSLYADHGYRQFKMSRFEEYDLYMKNKDFLISDGIITFNDTNGRLLALKPDVTLSIVKNSKDLRGNVQKVFYNENVYRISKVSHTYKEIMQTGLECIGDATVSDTAEVVTLALESAKLINSSYRAVFSHIGFLNGYLADQGIDPERDSELCRAFFDKNVDLLRVLCNEKQLASLDLLMQSYPDVSSARRALTPYFVSNDTKSAFDEFEELWNRVFDGNRLAEASVDLTLANSTGYYSGIVFKCYTNGIASPILSGGQYDGLMKKLGRVSHAIGFAVYLDELERLDELSNDDGDGFVNVALPKGRLGEKVYEMFEKAGYDCPSIKEQNRKLVFENPEKKVRYFWVKPSDVAIYVERGAADVGVAGYDILLEYSPDVYELCDLGLGKCRMAVATKKDFVDDENKTLRVATKFSNIAQRYYSQKGREIDVIHLNGSIEIAPLLGLSDVIVDIVETGKTLYENGLEPREDIVNISARLISNKASYRFKRETIEDIKESIARLVQNND